MHAVRLALMNARPRAVFDMRKSSTGIRCSRAVYSSRFSEELHSCRLLLHFSAGAFFFAPDFSLLKEVLKQYELIHRAFAHKTHGFTKSHFLLPCTLATDIIIAPDMKKGKQKEWVNLGHFSCTGARDERLGASFNSFQSIYLKSFSSLWLNIQKPPERILAVFACVRDERLELPTFSV